MLTRLRKGLRGLPRSRRELEVSLQLLAQLRSAGWQRSATSAGPVDETGQPVPWMTYAATRWLELVLRPDDRVFEYGAGASSACFGERCREVVSVEHDPIWVERVAGRLPRNCRVLRRATRGGHVTAPAGDGYVQAIAEVGGRSTSS